MNLILSFEVHVRLLRRLSDIELVNDEVFVSKRFDSPVHGVEKETMYFTFFKKKKER